MKGTTVELESPPRGSAAVPLGVAGASHLRFGSVNIHERGGPPHLQNWKWVWVCGKDDRTTAAEDGNTTFR
jgi:hypothetical protein